MFILDLNELYSFAILIFILFGSTAASLFLMGSYIAELAIMLKQNLIYKFHFIPFNNAYKEVY